MSKKIGCWCRQHTKNFLCTIRNKMFLTSLIPKNFIGEMAISSLLVVPKRVFLYHRNVYLWKNSVFHFLTRLCVFSRIKPCGLDCEGAEGAPNISCDVCSLLYHKECITRKMDEKDGNLCNVGLTFK